MYASLELTAPQYIIDLANILPAGVTLARIVSAEPLSAFAAIPVLQSFSTIEVMTAGRAFSPTSGLIQAISGEVQAPRVPAIVRFTCLNSDGSSIIVDGVYRGTARFVYFPTPIRPNISPVVNAILAQDGSVLLSQDGAFILTES